MDKIFLVVLMSYLSFILADDVFAYLDPATGSMLIQAVLAGIAAVGVSISIFWRRIKGFFVRRGRPEKSEADRKR